MEIIAISAVVGAVAFGLGIACGRSSPCAHEIIKLPTSDTVPASWLENERRQTRWVHEELEYVKRSCRSHHRPPFLGCDGCHHSTRYYAQTVEQQRMADMLAKAQDTAKQLVKDLRA